MSRHPNIDHASGMDALKVWPCGIDLAGRPIHLLNPLSPIIVRISVRACQDIHFHSGLSADHMGLDSQALLRPAKAVISRHVAGDIYRWISIYKFLNSILHRSPFLQPSPMGRARLTTCDWIDNAIVLQMSPTMEKSTAPSPACVWIKPVIARPAVALSHAEPKLVSLQRAGHSRTGE